MKRFRFTLAALFTLILFQSPNAFAGYSERLCKNDSNVFCITIKKGDTWTSLFPDPTQRDIVQRLNRKNTNLYRGAVIAVPNNIDSATVMEISPFPSNIGTQDRKTIVVDPSKLAWAAYDQSGQQINWGPASAGKSYCPDVDRRCTTPGGVYSIYRKEGSECFSKKFPIGKGGAPMPYCMFFHGGFALHGSPEVPGYNASHGCVRLFTKDARWLNEDFIDLPDSSGVTRVIVKPYTSEGDNESKSASPTSTKKSSTRASSKEQAIAF